jgi:CHAD domain-containing protein
MARAAEVPGFAEAETFADAAALVVEARAAEVFAFRERALDTGDIEGVHDMRVATRRLRAALEIFAVCFPRKPHRAVLKEVKRLADALGARRDPDVAIESMVKIGAALGEEDRAGIATLVEALRARQQAANEALAEELERIELVDLRARLEALAIGARIR